MLKGFKVDNIRIRRLLILLLLASMNIRTCALATALILLVGILGILYVQKSTVFYKDNLGKKIILKDIPSGVSVPTCGQPEYPCTWKLLESKDLGIRMHVQEYSEPNRYTYFIRNNSIEAHRLSDDRTFNGPLLITIFSKEADESIEDAISTAAYTDLPEAVAFGGCAVEKVENEKYNLNLDKEIFEYKAAGKYKEFVTDFNKKLEGKPAFDECGQYGETEGVRYFEYHPKESQTKFISVEGGYDYPGALFDPRSIELW